MPGLTTKSKSFTPKSKSKSKTISSRKGKKASLKSKTMRNNLKPHVTIVKRVVSFTSNPNPGKPYGHVVTMAYHNGKTVKSETNLNKYGQETRR